MFKRLLLALLFALLLFQPTRAAEVDQGQFSVRASVAMSSVYAWTVQRQSIVSIPENVRSGDRVLLQGVVKRQNGVPLKNQHLSLMIGRGDETLFAASSVTSSTGAYGFDLTIDEQWWGDYWVSVGVITYDRPVWLVLRQSLKIDPQVEMAAVKDAIVWRVDAVLKSTGQDLENTRISDQVSDTIVILTTDSNFDKERDVPIDSQMGARGRDSPVADRSFSDAGRGPTRTGGGRHQQTDQLPG